MTVLGETDARWSFALGDYDGDGGRPDLYAIKKSGTESHTTELHILSGRDDYRRFRRQTMTVLGETDARWSFALGDYDGDGGRPDLYAIKKSGTESHTTELHILSGRDDYRRFRRQTGTGLGETDGSWDFGIGFLEPRAQRRFRHQAK